MSELKFILLMTALTFTSSYLGIWSYEQVKKIENWLRSNTSKRKVKKTAVIAQIEGNGLRMIKRKVK